MSRMSVHKGKLIHRWPGDVRMCAIDSPHNTGEPSQGMKIARRSGTLIPTKISIKFIEIGCVGTTDS